MGDSRLVFSDPGEVPESHDYRRDFLLNPIEPADERSIVYEFSRPKLEGFPGVRHCPPNMPRSQWILNTLEEELSPVLEIDPSVKEWLLSLSDEDATIIYETVSLELESANKMVVDYNDSLASSLGCNNAAYHMGSNAQARNACFYLAKYLGKAKARLEESLTLLRDAKNHTAKHPSKAEDSDTARRKAMHWLTRVLNRLNQSREISDTQAAASNLGTPFEVCTDMQGFYDPNSSLDYIDDQKQKLYSIELLADRRKCSVFCSDDEGGSDSEGEDDDSDPDFYMPQANDFIANSGACRVYEVPTVESDSDSVTMVAVVPEEHYQHRPDEMANFSRHLFFSLVSIVPITTEEHSSKSERGRKGSKCYRFKPLNIGGMGTVHHKLENSHCLVLRSKQLTLTLCGGFLPKHPGDECKFGGSKAAWQKKADAFAKYFLVLFKPGVGCPGCQDSLNWRSFCEWASVLNTRNSLSDQWTLATMQHFEKGFSVPNKQRLLMNAYRTRGADSWSQEESKEAQDYFDSTGQNAAGDSWPSQADDLERLIVDEELMGLLDKEKRKGVVSIKYCELVKSMLSEAFGSAKGLNSLSLSARSVKCPASDSRRGPFLSASRSLLNEVWSKVKEPLVQTALPEGTATSAGGGLFCNKNNANYNERMAEHLESVSKLGKEQKELYDKFAVYFEGLSKLRAHDEPQQILEMVLGCPGTGKTRVTNIIMDRAEIEGVGRTPFAGPTGLSASLGKDGQTMHTMFQFPQQGCKRDEHGGVFSASKDSIAPLTADKLLKLIKSIEGDAGKVAFIVLDEVSMATPYFLELISCRLQQMKNNPKPFGGVSVLLVGDFAQIPPSGTGRALYAAAMKSVLEEKSDFATSEQRGVDLFKQFSLTTLVEQHRSKDSTHTDLIVKMGRGEKITMEDLNRFKKLTEEDARSEEWRAAPVLVLTNAERFDLTEERAVSFARDTGTVVVKWKKDIKKWSNKPSLVFEEEAGESPCLNDYFVVDAEGYITHNHQTDRKVVNGAPVRMHSISLDSGPETIDLYMKMEKAAPGEIIVLSEPPRSVNVQMFPGDKQAQDEAKKRGLPSLVENDLVIPILRGAGRSNIKDVWVSGGNGFEVSKAKVASLHDVQLAFVMTFHKSQGKTMKKVIIVVPKRPREMHCRMSTEIFYVGISRVEMGDDVRLLYSNKEDLSYLCELECSDYLRAWRKGFVDSKGKWNGEKAKKAFEKITRKKMTAARANDMRKKGEQISKSRRRSRLPPSRPS